MKFGDRTLILTKITPSQMSFKHNQTDIAWANHKLHYDGQSLLYDAKPVDIDALFNFYGEPVILTVKWSDFIAQIPLKNTKLDEKDDELTDNEELQCVICMDRKKAVSLNCGHAVLCITCANKIEKKCPKCRAEITEIKRVFF